MEPLFTQLIIVICLILLLIIIGILLISKKSNGFQRSLDVSQPFPYSISPELKLASNDVPIYSKRKSLLTYPEKVFYKSLINAINENFFIFIKVRMADILFLSNEPKNRKFHQNQVFCKHLDFVLCEPISLEPMLIIELDDSSHSKFDRKRSDQFKDYAGKTAKIPILRIKIQSKYSEEDLLIQINDKFNEEPP